MKINNFLEGFLTIIAFTALICLIIGLPVMLLWNWVIPDIFPNIPRIGFWQAFGLSLLCSLLFKSNVTIKKEN